MSINMFLMVLALLVQWKQSALSAIHVWVCVCVCPCDLVYEAVLRPALPLCVLKVPGILDEQKPLQRVKGPWMCTNVATSPGLLQAAAYVPIWSSMDTACLLIRSKTTITIFFRPMGFVVSQHLWFNTPHPVHYGIWRKNIQLFIIYPWFCLSSS